MSNSGKWWNAPESVKYWAIILALSLSLLMLHKVVKSSWASVRTKVVNPGLSVFLPHCPQQILKRGSPTASSCSSSASETWSSSLGILVIHVAPPAVVASSAAFMFTQYRCLPRPPVGAVPWRDDGAGIGSGRGCRQARLHHQVQWHQCWCEYFPPPTCPQTLLLCELYPLFPTRISFGIEFVIFNCFSVLICREAPIGQLSGFQGLQTDCFLCPRRVFIFFFFVLFNFKEFYQCLCNGQSLHRKGLTSFLERVDQITSLTHSLLVGTHGVSVATVSLSSLPK